MDRRYFMARALPAATLSVALSRWAGAAQPAPLAVVPLTTDLFMITGGGGNVTVFESPQGVLLVDGGSPERSGEVLKLVQDRTGASKIHTLFNTHWHWDQTGSNRALGPAGTRIIAHENTRLWLGTEIFCRWQHRTFKPLPPVARPNQTFYTTGSLTFGGEHIDYGYLPQAHTDGDLYVFFRDANVLVAGDVISVGAYPVIDYSTNGWIGGMLDATKTLTSLTDAKTRIVPGQGALQSRADIEAERDMLAAMKLRLSQLHGRQHVALGFDIGAALQGTLAGHNPGFGIRKAGQCFGGIEHAADPAIGGVIDDRIGADRDDIPGDQHIGVAEKDIQVAVRMGLGQVPVVDVLATERQGTGGVESLIGTGNGRQGLEGAVLPLAEDFGAEPQQGVLVRDDARAGRPQ